MESQKMKEVPYNGIQVNGFMALLLLFGFIAFTVLSFVNCANTESDAIFGVCLAGGIILAIWDFIMLFGFFTLEPNEAVVMVFFGKYKGTFTQHGFFWVNPFMACKKLTLRSRNLDAEPIKVNDKEGNPILIGLVMVWKLKDTYKAMFEIDAQSIAGQVAGTVGTTAAMRMNAFERQLVNRLQMQMSKREAEDALREIREALYDDIYHEIKPQYMAQQDGSVKKEYPPIKKIVWAYFNDRLDVLKNA